VVASAGSCVAQQVGPLGIKVTNIEPSGFRTDWARRSATFVEPQIADYVDAVGQNMKIVQDINGRQPGAPSKRGRPYLTWSAWTVPDCRREREGGKSTPIR
jgi:hypothetical protein